MYVRFGKKRKILSCKRLQRRRAISAQCAGSIPLLYALALPPVATALSPPADSSVISDEQPVSNDAVSVSEKSGTSVSTSESSNNQIPELVLPKNKTDGVPVQMFYKIFTNPETLDQAIRSYGDDQKFFSIFKSLFDNRAISQVINGLENSGRNVKARLSKVVQKHEGTKAYDIELSDQCLDERQHRHETSVEPGKTGVFVVLFKKILQWIYGRDFLDEVIRTGQERRRILDRLKVQGVTESDINPAELQEIIQLRIAKEAPFSGAEFNPYSSTWPDLNTPDNDTELKKVVKITN